jgi:hypothetical protein
MMTTMGDSSLDPWESPKTSNLVFRSIRDYPLPVIHPFLRDRKAWFMLVVAAVLGFGIVRGIIQHERTNARLATLQQELARSSIR